MSTQQISTPTHISLTSPGGTTYDTPVEKVFPEESYHTPMKAAEFRTRIRDWTSTPAAKRNLSEKVEIIREVGSLYHLLKMFAELSNEEMEAMSPDERGTLRTMIDLYASNVHHITVGYEKHEALYSLLSSRLQEMQNYFA